MNHLIGYYYLKLVRICHYNLHNNNKYGIILSWTIKGQNNDYIKLKMYELNYINDIENKNKLIMIFRKNTC
jgi:hypothetical protein